MECGVMEGEEMEGSCLYPLPLCLQNRENGKNKYFFLFYISWEIVVPVVQISFCRVESKEQVNKDS